MVQNGDYILNNQKYFTKDRFMSSIASYIRSGYPVIVLGDLKSRNQDIGPHAVCAVGFRDKLSSSEIPTITLEDSSSDILYIHDDNIGTNARFKIKTAQKNNFSYPVLHLEAPNYSPFPETDNYQIIPRTLVIATHNELRTSPEQLYSGGWNIAVQLDWIFRSGGSPIQLSLGTRFIKLTDYIHDELGRLLKGQPEVLSQLRLRLWEQVRPMSPHLGLVRIGLVNPSFPLLDVLYDTTDSNLQMFCYIPHHPVIERMIKDFQINFS